MNKPIRLFTWGTILAGVISPAAGQSAESARQQSDEALRQATAAAVGGGGAAPQEAGGATARGSPPAPSRTGSLFARQAAAAGSPQPVDNSPTRAQSSYFTVKPAEPRKIRKNDLVTVIIREQSDTQTKSTTDNKKSADLDALLQAYFDIDTSFPKLTANNPAIPPELKFKLGRNFKGEGKFDRSDSVTARITAHVIDVKPNGLLILQAEKHIKQDDEEQHFVLTGTARAEDVTLDNTVLSTQLADLRLDKNTKGAVSDTARRGWIPRLFDMLNPF